MPDRPFLHPLQNVVHSEDPPSQMASGLQSQQQPGSDGHHLTDYHLSGVTVTGVQSPSFSQLHQAMTVSQSSATVRSTFSGPLPLRPSVATTDHNGSADVELDSEAICNANAVAAIGQPPHQPVRQQQHGRIVQRHHHNNGLFVQF
jgi:hypothetical protein